MVFNNYGLGKMHRNPHWWRNRDPLAYSHRRQLEVKYFDRPSANGLDKMAFSFTGDLGCEMGGGVRCTTGTPTSVWLPSRPSSAGWRTTASGSKRTSIAMTLGGGQMNNPGRYLTLLPPINGANAISGTPYFTENPGDKMHAYDGTATFDYMPSEFITFRWEWGYRHTDVPYWTGHGGITPPGGNNGSPQQYACTVPGPGGNTASGYTDLPDATTACAGYGGAVWFPDLRTQQIVSTVAIMVKF